jgi:hypothetical protein
MRRLMFTAAILAASVLPGHAQFSVAPGWVATGEWQCGPVRIITSQPANGSIGTDFYVIGAWFNNHFTLYQGDTLYYNGVPCQTINYRPLPRPRPQKHVQAQEEPEPKCDIPGCDK